MLRRSCPDAFKTIAWGGVCLAGAVWFVLYELGNPVTDLRLMLHATTTQGEIVDTFQDVEDGDDGRAQWFHAVVYRFRLPDGRVLENVSRGDGRLRDDLVNLKAPVPAEVEYHPGNPALNRLKGSGSGTLAGWLVRTAASALLLGVLCWPGLHLVRAGLAERRAGRALSNAACESDTSP